MPSLKEQLEALAVPYKDYLNNEVFAIPVEKIGQIEKLFSKKVKEIETLVREEMSKDVGKEKKEKPSN